MVLCGGACAHAQASPRLVSLGYELAGAQSLAMTGSNTLVAAQGDDANSILSFAPGRKPVVIGRPRQIGDGLDDSELVASSTRVAVRQSGSFTGYKGCCDLGTTSLFTAPFGHLLQSPPVECRIAPGLDPSVGDEPGVLAHYAVALDRDVLAYDSFGCLEIADFASGLRRMIRLEATLDPVRAHQVRKEPSVLAVAERLVAYRSNPSGGEGPGLIVVYDIDSAQTLYRVPVPAAEPDNETSFSLQSDGTLIVDESHDCRATIVSPIDPSPQPLGISACAVYGVTEGRVLFTEPTAEGHLVLAWTTLQPVSPHIIVDFGKGGALQAAAPKISGTEAVYALGSCYKPHVLRTALSEPGTPPPTPATCPVHGAGYAKITRRGLTVSVRCPLGCTDGNLNGVRVGTEQQLQTAHGGTLVEPNYPNFSAPPKKTVRLLLPEQTESPEEHVTLLRKLMHTLRRLRRHNHNLYVRVNFNIATPSDERAKLPGIAAELESTPPDPYVIVPLR